MIVGEADTANKGADDPRADSRLAPLLGRRERWQVRTK